MGDSDDEPIDDLEARLRHDDPRFAHGLNNGRPRRPRKYRRGTAWLTLAFAVAAIVTGVLVPHGLLLAAGLVMAAFAVDLFDTRRRRGYRRRP